MSNPPPPPPPPPPPLPPPSHQARKIWNPNAATPPFPPPPSWPSKSSGSADPAPPPPPMPPEGFPSAYDTDHAWKLRFMQSLSAAELNTPFEPCHMFFYGSLMDPEVIQAILNLPEVPITSPATIFGFRIKTWGIYPALIPAKSGEVVGCVWEVNSEGHFDRLAAYETAAYTWVECEAVLEDRASIKRCRTFCWAGDPSSKELEDGSFDLERYQKYFKPSVIRRRSPPPF